jgi:aryl-alcohol dehydrogenase-like predicted oxidoreductase
MNHMDKRRIPNTDIEVSRLVLGTMGFGSQVDEAEAERMVARSREAGITMFDTANGYNSGRSEEILGKVVKRFRSDVQIVSKVGSPKDGTPQLTRKNIMSELEGSLRRLGTDYLDIYYLHAPDWRTPIEETLECMNEVVRSGKARRIGQSNYAAWQSTEMHALAEKNGWPFPVVSQQMYNLLARRAEDEYEAYSRHHKLFNIVYNPLAGGLLTGKHRIWNDPDAGTRFTGKQYQDRYWNQAQFDAVDRLRGIAADAGMNLIELSYRWLLSRPLVDSVLIGASSVKQLESNLAAAAGAAPDSDTVERIDNVWRSLHGVAPKYNR